MEKQDRLMLGFMNGGLLLATLGAGIIVSTPEFFKNAVSSMLCVVYFIVFFILAVPSVLSADIEYIKNRKTEQVKSLENSHAKD